MNFAYYGIEIEGATVHIQERPFSPVTRMVGGVRLSGDLPGDPYILNTPILLSMYINYGYPKMPKRVSPRVKK